MYTLEMLITLVFVTLVIGLVTGVIIAQRIGPSKQSQQKWEEHVNKLQCQQTQYQQKVTEHFSETGQLLNQLSKSYRDVHNHLANGAQILADPQAGEPIASLPENKAASTLPTEQHTVTPPLDYASKPTPDEKGMLNETFGLDKTTDDIVIDTNANQTNNNS